MNGRVRIGGIQLMVLTMLCTIGDGILVVPAFPADKAKQDAWLVSLFSIGVGMLIIFLYYALSQKFPKLTLVQYSEKLLGKWVGIPISLLFVSYTYLTVPILLREMGDFMTSLILPETPILVFIILFTALVLMGARLGLEPIARSAEILFPFSVLLMVILFISLFPEGNINNIEPIFKNGFKPIVGGSFQFITFSFSEVVPLLMVLPYVDKGVNVKKSLLLGAFMAGIVLAIITTMSVLILGYEQSAELIYPGYELAKKVNIGAFITRVEAILAGIWLITIFFKISLLFLATLIGLSQTLRLKSYSPLIFPLGMMMVVLALVVSPNISFFINEIEPVYPFFDAAFAILLPLLLLVVAVFRKKLKNN